MGKILDRLMRLDARLNTANKLLIRVNKNSRIVRGSSVGGHYYYVDDKLEYYQKIGDHMPWNKLFIHNKEYKDLLLNLRRYIISGDESLINT